MGVRLGGVATIKVDGNQYALKGAMEINPSAVRREGVAGQDYVHGYLENPIVPSIKGEFSTVPGLSTEDLESMTNVTVQADIANGSTYILAEAWTVAAYRIESQRGQLEIEWQGTVCDELTA